MGIFPVLFSGPAGRRRKYKWLGLASVFLFLACGGSIAWFMMKNAAHKLAGGPDSRLESDSSLYSPNAGVSRTGDFFASEEELAKAAPALKNELLGGRGERGGGVPGSGVKVRDSETGGRAPAPGENARFPGTDSQAAFPACPRSAAFASVMSRRPAARGLPAQQQAGAASSGPGDVRTQQPAAFGAGGAPNAAAPRQLPAAGGGKAAAGAGKVARTSVLTSFKSALRSAIYGARTASKDSARNWTAKTFDGVADAGYSIEYDEKTKAALDRINPDSIPAFLKEQSLDADAARSLPMSEVGAPVDDPAAEEALKGKKDLAQTLFPLFGLFGGARGGGSDGYSGGGELPSSDSPPATNDISLQDYMDTHGYGAECGCTRVAPCCCLPPNYFTGGPLGDFPPPGGTLPV